MLKFSYPFFFMQVLHFNLCSCFVPSTHATIQFATSVYEIGPQISIVSYQSMRKKWNKCNTDFSFIVLHIGLTYIMRRLISCKNEEKCQSENQVSANVKLFRRIYAETATETAGNTEKPVRLLDSIFTLPPEEGTKKHVSGTEFRVSAT